jgi:hypothetical protein
MDKLILYVGATRYYLGRMTYAVSEFCEGLVKDWPKLRCEAQSVIKHDVEEAFARDDEARTRMSGDGSMPCYLPLGHDCDRASWENVRKLWNKENS